MPDKRVWRLYDSYTTDSAAASWMKYQLNLRVCYAQTIHSTIMTETSNLN